MGKEARNVEQKGGRPESGEGNINNVGDGQEDGQSLRGRLRHLCSMLFTKYGAGIGYEDD